MKYQKEDLASFSNQLQIALNHYKPHGLKASQFDNVILCGLGGSGIAGRIIKSLLSDTFPLPIEIVSGYTIPAFVGSNTLAVICSYSGNTEETNAMYDMAKQAGATIISIATGGELKRRTLADGNIFYQAEPGLQPRMALGYPFTYLYLIMNELVGKDAKREIADAMDALSITDGYVQAAGNYLQDIKHTISSKIVVLADAFYYPVGLRFCQQIQENAKSEAFIHELPEANHNVIESYYGKLDTVFVLLDSGRNRRTSLRFSFLKDLLEKNGNTVVQLNAPSDSLRSVLETVYLLDWLSLWIADHKNVNSAQIPNINALKEYLSVQQ